MIETFYGPGRLLSALTIIQKECDRQSGRIMEEFIKRRQLSKINIQINDFIKNNGASSGSSSKEKLDPKVLDLLIGEISVLHSRIELYFKFIRRRIIVSL